MWGDRWRKKKGRIVVIKLISNKTKLQGCLGYNQHVNPDQSEHCSLMIGPNNGDATDTRKERMDL